MNLNDVVLMTGGSVRSSHLPSCISRADYALLTSWLKGLQRYVDGISKGAKVLKIELRFIQSPSLVCRIRTLDDGSVAVLLPLGLSIRVRTFGRLLLSYFGRKAPIQIASSLLDDYPESHWRIAPSLVPLFGEFADEAEHWRQLATLDSQIQIDPELEPAVNELLWAALCYLTWHEVAHAIRGHFSIEKDARTKSCNGPPIGEVDIRKALEIDADCWAAFLMLFTTLENIKAAGQEAELGSCFFWIGYSITLVFGLYDSRRKALDLYSQAFYPHPIIRHRLFLDFATAHIAERWPELAELWEKETNRGWNGCVAALRNLDVDVMTGKFGGNTKKPREVAQLVPVTAMTYNVFDQSFVHDGIQKDKALLRQVFLQFGPGRN